MRKTLIRRSKKTIKIWKKNMINVELNRARGGKLMIINLKMQQNIVRSMQKIWKNKNKNALHFKGNFLAFF